MGAKQRYPAKQNKCGAYFTIINPKRHQFTKFSLASRSVSQHSWITVVLYGCKHKLLTALWLLVFETNSKATTE